MSSNHNIPIGTRPTQIQYLQGIRGIAILFIVLFHIWPRYFPHGYLGVDIFFVLSGYLLFKSEKKNNAAFSIGQFLCKKIVRIIPSLGIMLIIVGIGASALLLNEESFRLLSSSMAYSQLCLSNKYYIQAYSDYFSAGANMNPLLHTWFLSVIVQIYVVWALAKYSIQKIGKLTTSCRCVSFLIGIIAITSFCYSFSYDIQRVFHILELPTWGQIKPISYYDTFGRLWQILAGGLIFMLPQLKKSWMRAVVLFTSVALIFLSLCVDVVPSSLSVFAVVLGTILLITYLHETRIQKIFESKYLIWLGNISFSVFLVHYPIIVCYKLWAREYPDLCIGFVILLISVIVGYVFSKLIEQRKFKFRTIVGIVVLTLLLAFGIRKIPVYTSFSIQYPIYQVSAISENSSIYRGFDEEIIVPHEGTQILHNPQYKGSIHLFMPFGKAGKTEFLLMGDSNAQHLYAGVNEVSDKLGIRGVHLTSTVIPLTDVYVHVNKSYNWNQERYNALISWLKEHPEIHTVIISQLWSRLQSGNIMNWNNRQISLSFAEKTERLRNFLDEIKKLERQVVLVMPSPFFPNMNEDLYIDGLTYARWADRRGINIEQNNLDNPMVLTRDEYEKKYKDTIALFKQWEEENYCCILHIEKGIFKDNDIYNGYKNNTLYCRDQTHITPPAAIEIMDCIKTDLNDIIMQGRLKSRVLFAD